MKLIDMHCDTLGKLMDVKGSGDLYDNLHSVNIRHMKNAGTKAQFFACFTCKADYENAGGYEKAYQRVHEMIAYGKGQFDRYEQEIAIARSWQEYQENAVSGRISAILTVEEGGVLNGRVERLHKLYEEGIRLMTLMWNYENCLGHPNSPVPEMMKKGLTEFGIEVTKQMGSMGMIVDVSHASDGTFSDILRYASGPVVASHSNCRELCSHPRNLSDEMIRELADTGGIAGVNFYGPFLGKEKVSRIDEIAAHILHMLNVGGSEFPAVGTDFDGIDGLEYLEIPDVSKMELLWEVLKKRGVSESQLDKIWGGNAERILQAI